MSGRAAGDRTILLDDLRVSFCRGTFALQEALYGVEHGDRAAFARSMTGYRD